VAGWKKVRVNLRSFASLRMTAFWLFDEVSSSMGSCSSGALFFAGALFIGAACLVGAARFFGRVHFVDGDLSDGDLF
jgi:hypothetical protein